jgi:predicted RNA-binding protein Jag
MSGREHTPHQILLIALHNSGAIIGKTGKTLDELTKLTNINREELEGIIASQITSGYLEYSTDQTETKRYHLTGRGIIRVSSLYT